MLVNIEFKVEIMTVCMSEYSPSLKLIVIFSIVNTCQHCIEYIHMQIRVGVFHIFIVVDL